MVRFYFLLESNNSIVTNIASNTPLAILKPITPKVKKSIRT